VKSEFKKKFKETEKRMMEEIIQKETEYERKKQRENYGRGNPNEQSKLKRIAKEICVILRIAARVPDELEVMIRMEQEERLADAKLTEYERKAKQEEREQKKRQARPKKIACALAGCALLMNMKTFFYTAVNLCSGKTKSEIEREISLGRQYLVNGLWLGDELMAPYPPGYRPKEIKAYVTEKTFEWIKSQPPPQPISEEYRDIKTTYIVIKQDENGKEYIENFTLAESILFHLILNPVSKPGRELAYHIIKSEQKN
jgi:hypothetical protein